MDSSRRNVGLPTRGAGEPTLVTRTCPVPDVSLRAFLAEREPPRIHWTTPDGCEIAGSGAVARVTADGRNRFDDVREAAEELFADVDAARVPPADDEQVSRADDDRHGGEAFSPRGSDESETPDAGSREAGPLSAGPPDSGPPQAGTPDAARPMLFGGFAFGDNHEPASPWEGFPGAEFVLPALRLTRTDDGTWLTVASAGPEATPDDVVSRLESAREAISELPSMGPTREPPGVTATERTTTREEWHRQVEAALGRIDRGELTKVVLAQALSVGLSRPIDAPDVLERLRASYPDCYRFLVEPTPEAGFLGAPPERLVALTGDTVETEALAGSVARGETPQADEELAAHLRDSEKIQREHRVVVDTICDQLAPLATAVTVDEQTIRKLTNIQHVQTPIRARMADGVHVLDVVEALHPTPAVGGLPPDAAFETIREAETFDRGWYAAPVGWFDAAGDGEFAVGIRSAVTAGDRATLFAGNGIVAESDPDEEWDEVELKYRPVLDALE